MNGILHILRTLVPAGVLVTTAAALLMTEGPSAQSSPAGRQAAVKVLTTEQIAAAAGNAVVTIVTFDQSAKQLGQGSGFIVRPDGVIVTNWHVMRGASKAVVTLKTGESFDRVSYLAGDEAADVALLKIPGLGLPSMPTTSTVPEVGSRVVALGSPLGLSGSVSEGIVSAVRLIDGRQLIQTTAAISPGSSGGPLVNSSGRAFAVATESLEGRGVQQLNFGVPVKYAMGLLSGDVAERSLAGSPLGVLVKRSDFSVSAADYASWSRPGRTPRPIDDLTGQYLFVSRSAASDTGAMKGKRLGFLVIGNLVGLWASPTADGKQFNVVPIGPLTTGAEGAVALNFMDLGFAGYQTDDGFWVSHDSRESGEVLEIQTKRVSSQAGETNGLYSVSCRTVSVGSLAVAGSLYPIRDPGPLWVGDAVIIVASDQIHIDLLMRNDSGGSVRLQADGPISGGRFDLTDGSRRLAGTLAGGVLQAQWIDERSAILRFEGPLRGERR